MRLLIVLSLLILQINLISSARVHSKSEIDCSPHHNDHRKNLLEYDSELAERALELAKIYETNQLSGRKTEGINYYTEETDSDSDFDDDYLCEAAVSSWFDEISHYNSLDTDSRIRSNKNKYFHYIQLSWNTTESVGCGYAQSNNRFTVACVYRNKSNMSNSIKKHVPVNSFEKNLLKKNYEDLCHIGPVFYDYTQSQAVKTKVHNKIIKTKQYCANIDDDDDDYDGRQNNRRRNQDDDEEDFNNEDKKKNNGRNNRNDNNNRNDRNNRNDNNNRNDRNNRNENKNNTRNNDPEFKKLNDKLDRLEKLVQNLKNSSHTNNNNNNNNNRTTRRRRIVRRRLIPFPF